MSMNINEARGFAKSIEAKAYSRAGGLEGEADGLISKQELEAALKTGRLQGDQLELAQGLFDNFDNIYGTDDGVLNQQELMSYSPDPLTATNSPEPSDIAEGGDATDTPVESTVPIGGEATDLPQPSAEEET